MALRSFGSNNYINWDNTDPYNIVFSRSLQPLFITNSVEDGTVDNCLELIMKQYIKIIQFCSIFQSPIHIAAAAHNADKCLEILLADNNDPEAVNAVTKDQRTPLHLTAIRGQYKKILILSFLMALFQTVFSKIKKENFIRSFPFSLKSFISIFVTFNRKATFLFRSTSSRSAPSRQRRIRGLHRCSGPGRSLSKLSDQIGYKNSWN